MAALVLAWSSGAGAVDRLERRYPVNAQCIGRVRGGRTFVAPLGASSPELCASLIQRCANSGQATSYVPPVPQRVDPPYTLCN